MRGVSDPLHGRADGPNRGPGGRSRPRGGSTSERCFERAAARDCATTTAVGSLQPEPASSVAFWLALTQVLVEDFCTAFCAELSRALSCPLSGASLRTSTETFSTLRPISESAASCVAICACRKRHGRNIPMLRLGDTPPHYSVKQSRLPCHATVQGD